MMRRRSRWPMATGFTLQLIVASVVVIVPLLSTGIIPISSHVALVAPARYTPVEPAPAQSSSSSTSNSSAFATPRQTVVALSFNNNSRIGRPATSTGHETQEASASCVGCVQSTVPTDLIRSDRVIPVPAPRGPVAISHISEANLLKKIVPEYPRMAQVAGVQGDVKLHALIGKDGTIQSLSVISGHPMLTPAAINAVSQWKYKPFYLNGEAIEIETYITVTFRKSQ